MQALNFDEIVEKMIEKDPRYPREAYIFVREGLDHTQKQHAKQRSEQLCHVTGQELVAGMKDYALSQYGPMSLMVLGEWGIARCEDFGELVFNMIDHGLLSKTDTDTREDFKGGYDFQEAFRKPFQPARKASPLASQPKAV